MTRKVKQPSLFEAQKAKNYNILIFCETCGKQARVNDRRQKKCLDCEQTGLEKTAIPWVENWKNLTKEEI